VRHAALTGAGLGEGRFPLRRQEPTSAASTQPLSSGSTCPSVPRLVVSTGNGGATRTWRLRPEQRDRRVDEQNIHRVTSRVRVTAL
jgi:hypothetical protein